MNMRNNIGPSTVPWGTPDVTGILLDVSPSRITVCVLSVRKSFIQWKALMKHLEYNNILYDLQHGFRSSRSCETQLVSFIQDLAKSSDKNIQTDLWMYSARSFMNMRNNIGPSTVPWRTPDVTGILLDVSPSRITVCVLSVRKSYPVKSWFCTWDVYACYNKQYHETSRIQ
jgi:hypothetical protein